MLPRQECYKASSPPAVNLRNVLLCGLSRSAHDVLFAIEDSSGDRPRDHWAPVLGITLKHNAKMSDADEELAVRGVHS